MPDGTVYSYTDTDNNELQNLQIPGVGNISYPSYTMSRPDSVTFPVGSQHYQYDALMRLKNINAQHLDYAYTYDHARNILTKQTEHGNYAYDYDDLYRLTDVGNPTLDDEAYSYDPVGNRLTASGVSGNIEYNANNELENYGDISYDYGANGNMVGKTSATETRQYIYNVQNRLIRVEDELIGLIIAEYGYDPFGRRLWKEVDGTRTYFFYADEGLVAEYDEHGNGLRSYGYTPDSSWTTDPLWLKQNGEYFFYQNDHLGTPQNLVKQNGTVVWKAHYTAFGKATIEVETIVNNLRFPGQYYDAETGLHYNYQRYYDPRTGRYFIPDPIKFLGHDVNLYGYVWNSPVNLRDPWGLKVYLTVDYVRGIGAWVELLDNTHNSAYHCAIVIQSCDGKTIETYESSIGNIDPELNAPIKLTPYHMTRIKPAGPRFTPNWPLLTPSLTKVTLESGCDMDEPYKKVAQDMPMGSEEFPYYDLMNNNCCHWARRVIEAAGGQWPLLDDINRGANPGNPEGWTYHVPHHGVDLELKDKKGRSFKDWLNYFSTLDFYQDLVGQ